MDPKRSGYWKFVGVFITFVALGTGAFIFSARLRLSKTQWPPVTTQPKESITPIAGIREEIINNDVYTLRLKRRTGSFGTREYGDFSIFHIDPKSNTETLLVQSVKSIISSLQKFNHTLIILSFPSRSQKIYFSEIIDPSDGGILGIYSFDIKSESFRRLTGSDYYNGLGASAISPDGTRIISSIDPSGDTRSQKLFLINLDEDLVVPLVTLTDNETLNYCISDCLGDNFGDAKWLDDQTISYAVYDMSTVTGTTWSQAHPLIEWRMIKL